MPGARTHSHDHDRSHGSGSVLLHLRHFRDFWQEFPCAMSKCWPYSMNTS